MNRSLSRNPVARAITARKWSQTATSAQIHALMGDDSDGLVNAAGRVFFVILGACALQRINSDTPDVRILRGACNALYEQAGEPRIDDMRRKSLQAGLEACERLNEILERRHVTESACDLADKLRQEHVHWSDFEPLIGKVAS